MKLAEIPPFAIDPYVQGDTWRGLLLRDFQFPEEEDWGTLTGVSLQFRTKGSKTGSKLWLELSTSEDEGSITIVDADTWETRIGPVHYDTMSELDAGEYEFDVKFVNSLDQRFTLVRGFLTVLRTVNIPA